MHALSHLKALQALEAAVRTGSLRAAASELSLTPAAVGQRIKTLEDYLGVELLARGHDGVAPTPALTGALPSLERAFRELEHVATTLDLQRAQEIHLVADSDWVDLWLAPRLPGFHALAPNARLCINGRGEVAGRPGDADAEVWFGPSRSGAYEYPLFRDWLLPVGSPENVARLTALPAESCLEGFPLLHLDCYGSDPAAIDWLEWTRRFGQPSAAAGRGIRYRRVVPALEAVASHAGLLLCGLGLVQRGIADGSLALPFPLRQGAWTGEAYRLGFTDSAARRPQLARFRDWLLAEAEATERQIADAISFSAGSVPRAPAG